MQMFFLEISSQLSSSSLLINSRSRLHSVGLMFTDDVCHLTQNPLKRDTSAVHICQNPELSPHGALKCALALAPLTQGKLNIRPRLTCLRGYQVMLIPCPVASVSGGAIVRIEGRGGDYSFCISQIQAFLRFLPPSQIQWRRLVFHLSCQHGKNTFTNFQKKRACYFG